MIVYFADRGMNILGQASSDLPGGIVIKSDELTEDLETGIALFDATITAEKSNYAAALRMVQCGNYVLLEDANGDARAFTISETEADSGKQEIILYSEDAGLDLINEIAPAYAADQAYPIAHYIEKFAYDSGFVIGINELQDEQTLQLSWDSESTCAERIADVTKEFDAEISYRVAISGLKLVGKYIDIMHRLGRDPGAVLHLGYDVASIITTTSISNLSTALLPTGGTPEGEDSPIDLRGYSYDDGDIYLENGYLKSRVALARWSRYQNPDEPSTNYTGHILRSFYFDTVDQGELCDAAVKELRRCSNPEINYKVDISGLQTDLRIGDTVNITGVEDDQYLSARVIQMTTSETKGVKTITLGDYLIRSDGNDRLTYIQQEVSKAKSSAETAKASAEAANTGAESAKALIDSHTANTTIHVTASEKSNWNAKSDFSGNYDDLTGKPTIPTKTSDLSNDSGFITSVPVASVNGKTGNVRLVAEDIPAQNSGLGYQDVQSGLTELEIKVNEISSNSVSSVNGKTGIVNLTAEDVEAAPESHMDKHASSTDYGHVMVVDSIASGAGPGVVASSSVVFSHINDSSLHVTSTEKSTWNSKSDFSGDYNDLTGKPTIPTKTSDLSNDSGFISSVPVSSVNGKTGDVQLTAEDVEAAKESYVDNQISIHAKQNASGTQSGHVMIADSQVSGGSSTPVAASARPVFNHIDNQNIHVTQEEKSAWDSKSDFSGNYSDLSGKPTIPTKTSQLTNDSGFISSAPVSSVNGKMGAVVLTSEDVGAAPNSHVDKTATDTTPGHVLIDNSLNSGVYVENYVAAGAIPTFRHINNGGIHVTSAEKNAWDAKSDFSGDYSDLTGKPEIPTKTSQLTNDSGFLTSAPVSSVNGKTGEVLLTALDVGADTSGAASIVMDNLHIHTDDTTIHVTSGEKATWNAKSDFSGDYNDLLNKPDIPSTASDVGASPTNHRSTGTSYGKGDSTYYGHLKLSAALNSTSGVSSGIAATPSAIKALYDVIKLIDHGTWTPKCASISSPTQAIGTYIIINDLCVISFCIYGASSSTSTNSLSLRITGLPFEPDSSVKWFGGGGNVAGVRMNANYAFSGFVIEQNATYGAVILPRCVQTSTSAGTRSSGYCVNASGSTMYMAGTIMYRIA